MSGGSDDLALGSAHASSEIRPGARRGLRHTRRYREARRGIGKVVARTIGARLVGWHARSWKYEELERERRLACISAGGVLLAMWHGRMLYPIPLYRGLDFTVLVSGSDDGDLSEALLRGFGYDVVRGSASRGGASALRALLAALDRGSTVAITPDGPRGPRHSMNPGLAWMAKATGYPILPAGFACVDKRESDSWDRYNVPRRGARIVAAYGEPIRVPRDADREHLDEATARIRSALIQAERAGFARLGEDPDF